MLLVITLDKYLISLELKQLLSHKNAKELELSQEILLFFYLILITHFLSKSKKKKSKKKRREEREEKRLVQNLLIEVLIVRDLSLHLLKLPYSFFFYWCDFLGRCVSKIVSTGKMCMQEF